MAQRRFVALQRLLTSYCEVAQTGCAAAASTSCSTAQHNVPMLLRTSPGRATLRYFSTQPPSGTSGGGPSSSSSSSSGAGAGSRMSRLGSSIPAARAAEAAAAAKDPLAGTIAGSIPKGFFAARQDAFNAIPKTPKLLGFGGAIPFLLLHPALASYLDFDEYARDVANGQVAYGALIVSFLGAVHWGIAMTSTLTGANARLLQRDRYIWSVFPALAAWPALMMEPGPGSFCIALLLGICYMSDRAHAKQGALPAWYMTLRGYLSTIAALSMLSTAAWFLSKDFEKMRKRMEEDDRRRAAKVAASLEPPPTAMRPAVAAPAPSSPAGAAPAGSATEAGSGPARKKGWW